MRTFIGLAAVLGISLIFGGLAKAQAPAPAPADAPTWAYGIAPPGPAGAPAAEPAHNEDEPLRVPGSSNTFTLKQIEDSFSPADWFPQDHPVMPEVVAHGRRPGVRACSYCHYPNGKGRPSNGSVSGLPVAYFTQAIEDFKNGLRTSADPRKNNINQMIAFAKALTPEDVKAAAEYFGAIPWTRWVRVVETERVPKTKVEGFIHFRLPGNETEPIGARIVEVPEDNEQTEPLRNPRSGFIAYAPVGSIKKGEMLVTTGGSGKTVQCGICHGPDLKGLGSVPGIAGRSPSFLVRQMHDMQVGTRKGPGTALMKAVVGKLTNDDHVAIAAYVSSRG
jgi:cytochrome c553